MKKVWKVKSELKTKINRQAKIIKILLENRGLSREKDREEFFKPKLPIELELKDIGIYKGEIEKTIKRLKKALENKEKIIIYGDYDADGICATAILWETLYSIGFSVMPFLPHREKQGYGLKPKGIEIAIKEIGKPSLLITVDNGIVAFEGAEFCRKEGIDLIITDHHEAIAKSNKYPENKTEGKEIPECLAFLHSTETAGAGISFLLAKKILEEFGDKNELREKIDSLTEIATIGIVADLVPLLKINRSIVKRGLEVLPKTKRPGLKALLIESGIASLEKFSTYHIGYVIGPRLNAAGRLVHPIDSLRLLCTKDKDRGIKLAIDLAGINKDRQQLTDESLNKVISRVKESKKKIIITASEKYNPGVIGLIAGKITEKFYRPSIAISIMGEVAKGSVRSIPGVNIIAFLRNIESEFLELGGHGMAAGFSLESKNLDLVTRKLENLAEEEIEDKFLVPTIEGEVEINLSDLSIPLWEEIEKLAPFGVGNPKPEFISQDLILKSFNAIGKDNKHLKLWLGENLKENFEAIFFGGGYLNEKLEINKKIKALYQIDLNKWNGESRLQIVIRELETR